ncbi:hypothetical protein Asulf_00922 [Archaeoglobus sulfaticallidus PM70-1]|uniref:PKD domain-containing protein n=1 Tax=Archaeoglobus sulfaticallidus PM70-1 TaxID=387631 RepID=N0BF84_9EURY|nr:PKD domain-containing protein [Archaeoglobus sulfaticallidus]AGK60927.1 hypothetical protein Asulf_00922 [Archaeoglobus sulfaticallidus PM70-1]
MLKLFRIFLILIVLLAVPLIAPSSALTLDVNGGCVNSKVTASVDQQALIIFRMNNGTPVFAKTDDQAYFIPRITGVLNVTAIADESVTKFVKIVVCKTESSGGGLPANYLPDGTFTELGKTIKWRTAYGALKKATETLGISYKPELKEWGIFVDCINGLCSKDLGETSGWMYWVNYPDEPLPGIVATDYEISPGDRIVWYFSRSMSETPETSLYKIEISIGSNYEVHASIKWITGNKPPIAKFDYTPENPVAGERITFNASLSYDEDGDIISYLWDFGDGHTASGKVVTHSFEKAGRYEVRLTVEDDKGVSSLSVKTLVVSEQVRNENLTKAVQLQAQKKVAVEIPEELAEKLSITNLTLSSNEPKCVEVRVEESHTPKGILYGSVYRSFKIEVNSSVAVEIDFKVPKEVADGKRVVVMKYNGTWVALPTEFIREDGKYLYYRTEARSLSIFAIVVEWKGFPLNASDERIQIALKWLKSIQNEDGGFSNPGEESSIGKTSWAIMAIVSAGEDPHNWTKNGKSPVDYIRDHLRGEMPKMGTADYARTILALVAADENPRNFDGIDLVAELKSKMKDDGQIGDFVYTTIWGILALTSVGEDVNRSVEWLKAQQNQDGGFAWAVGEQSDFDDTSSAIQALIAAGEPRDSDVIKKALDYLKQGQNDDGGMRYFGTSASNSASDAWAIQALTAAGLNPAEWKKNNISVVEHLLSLQTDDGYFRYTSYQTSNPGYMTVSAIMALLGKPHPIKVMETETKEAVKEAKGEVEEETVGSKEVQPEAKPEATATPTSALTATPEKKTPGFGIILIILAMVVAVAVSRR